MSQRMFVIWCGLGSGTAALLWMCNVLLAANRQSELMLVSLLGSAAMGLLAWQARKTGSGFGGYFGFAVSTLCFLLAVLTMLDRITI